MTELRLASWNIRAGLGRDLRRRLARMAVAMVAPAALLLLL